MVVTTFTGDQILYSPETHEYRTLDGRRMLSGSVYAEWFADPFDREKLLRRTAKKLGLSEEFLGRAWDLRGDLSRTFGTSLHKAMECWFRFSEIGYGLPKHPLLRRMVETFPLRESAIFPEIIVSDLGRGLCGQVDGLVLLGRQTGVVIDYKSDAEIGKNLTKHYNQLSFYSHVLMAAGWTIEEVRVWNYTSEWECYSSAVLPLNEKAIEEARPGPLGDGPRTAWPALGRGRWGTGGRGRSGRWASGRRG